MAVSIRLADAWPFQPAHRDNQQPKTPLFQSALRMRGLFNINEVSRYVAEPVVSIRLADAWPFQLARQIR